VGVSHSLLSEVTHTFTTSRQNKYNTENDIHQALKPEKIWPKNPVRFQLLPVQPLIPHEIVIRYLWITTSPPPYASKLSCAILKLSRGVPCCPQKPRAGKACGQGGIGVAVVYPRRRSLPRPAYMPTAIAERLSQPVLPSDRLSPFERAQLAKHGYDPKWLDTLTPDIVHVRIQLPLKPVPDFPLKVYKPPESKKGA